MAQSKGRWPLETTILYSDSPNKLCELLQWLCFDDIRLVIISMIIIFRWQSNKNLNNQPLLSAVFLLQMFNLLKIFFLLRCRIFLQLLNLIFQQPALQPTIVQWHSQIQLILGSLQPSCTNDTKYRKAEIASRRNVTAAIL